MAGTVFLRTNRFEVKLEAITFKTKEFDQLCAMDFIFPKRKVWQHPPVVGLDVIQHPRDPNIVLMLLCFGVGCVILRFRSGDCLSEQILNFLTDKRIHFVGFGIPEKSDLLPFDELGLTMYKTDVGYMAAKLRNNPKFAKCDLAELARKVLGIKEMEALTEASSFARHEKIKSAMCQLFLSSVIGMALLRADSKNILKESPKKMSFLKRFNSMQLLNEGWSKIAKGKKDIENKLSEVVYSYYGVPGDDILADDSLLAKVWEGYGNNNFFQTKISEDDSGDDSVRVREGGRLGDDYVAVSGDDIPGKENASSSTKPLKGILKCPHSNKDHTRPSSPSSPTTLSPSREGPTLRRANSKGHNVTFKCDMGSL
ncbi:Polynucleotidyl transferase [Heracleum sosnowskyi]|uniref:Polynucleotidyl transferase n=1 Tax=Heracleum sosnowskyi TaxID=360622 RepID=A0AAD8HL27_9APIA|nr:Polynucleotidyl transferase [Heracleum sosnowskyi]